MDRVLNDADCIVAIALFSVVHGILVVVKYLRSYVYLILASSRLLVTLELTLALMQIISWALVRYVVGVSGLRSNMKWLAFMDRLVLTLVANVRVRGVRCEGVGVLSRWTLGCRLRSHIRVMVVLNVLDILIILSQA